jgi:hypothetical protein
MSFTEYFHRRLPTLRFASGLSGVNVEKLTPLEGLVVEYYLLEGNEPPIDQVFLWRVVPTIAQLCIDDADLQRGIASYIQLMTVEIEVYKSQSRDKIIK